MSLSIERQGGALRVEYRLSLCWAGGAASVALLLFCFLATSQNLTGVRRIDGRVDATLQQSRFGCVSARQPILDLRLARLEAVAGRSRHDQPGDSRITFGSHQDPDTFRVVLVDGAGTEHPVTSYRSSGEAHHRRFADAINRQLANPHANRWTVGQPVHPATYLLLVLAALAGGAPFFTRGSLTVDPAASEVRLVQPGLRASRIRTIALDQVREFTTVLRPSGSDDQTTARPALVHRDGTVEVLRHWSFVSDDEVLTMVNALERHRAAAELDRARRTSAAAEAPPAPTAKICAACGRDCSDAERVRDPLGRYYHATCVPPGR